ncbi:MAG TPA: hypothetical protein P5307_08085 [Pirellulaceae bacterium]|nr:hypothetical protein [Planctomycetales bacterium]HRX79007.1 hypothetical protein [Pirellulaceae bacterium]
MSPTVQQFLESFEGMPDGARKEIALEILRRTVTSETTTLSDEELTAAAEDIFLMLDASEADDGQST